MYIIKNKALLFILLPFIIYGQESIDYPIKSYDFFLYDDSDSYTMYKFNQNYISGYRVFSRALEGINNHNKKINNLIKIAVSVFTLPLTHEEGHRSVLTHKNIGSISQPFFNNKGAAYVKGVKDETLINLRDNNFPYYIRLHTAGLESDYMISTGMERLLVFEEESLEILKVEYLFRKIALIQYHLTSLIPSLFSDFEEEDNELERDIVGHDIFGAVRHLHRPNEDFYRYTKFDDLTNEEKKYVRNLAWKSFANLLSPILYGKNNFQLNSNLKGNISIGHSLTPFGDYFEQFFYLHFKNKYKLSFYLRELMNKNKIFLGLGAKLYNYHINDRFSTSGGFDIWNQPRNNSFTTEKNQTGYSGHIKFNYTVFTNNSYFVKRVGVFSEVFYKSDGFLPEYASLESDFGLRFGFYFSY